MISWCRSKPGVGSGVRGWVATLEWVISPSSGGSLLVHMSTFYVQQNLTVLSRNETDRMHLRKVYNSVFFNFHVLNISPQLLI